MEGYSKLLFQSRPEEFLKGYRGYLQADAYGGDDARPAWGRRCCVAQVGRVLDSIREAEQTTGPLGPVSV
jgi:hypothetical protein